MDLSVNNIKINKKALNFKGVKGDLNSKNTPIFRFTTPSHKQSETPYLELLFLRETDSKSDAASSKYKTGIKVTIEFDGQNTIEVPQEILEQYKAQALAYRYIFKQKNGTQRTALDAFKTVQYEGEERNIIEVGNNYGITPKGGAMYHAFIDSVGYKPKDIDENIKDFIRTHANKLGGSIKGLSYLLDHHYFDSYRYIISTPDIGADSISAHGYWPINQYQCSNMKDFKDFNFKLFEQGKGYIADGAFTSQSLQSPLVQHVLKWGEQSPFYYMLKVEDKMQLGIIPENKNAYDNVGIRLINSPLTKDYNKNRPTYIQFVDNRLLDDEQRQDTKKPITKYGKSNPDDHYDSVGYQDTIHPFYFEIENKDFDKKLKCFDNKDYIMLKDLTPEEQEILLGFTGGEITNRYEASNATFWDGNVDIVKMNLSNPDITNEKSIEGFKSAREYLYGVATFWTEAIQSDLLKRTARMNTQKVEQIAKNGGLTNEEIQEIKTNISKNKFNSTILKQDKPVEKYIKEFPLQSIETSPELSAVFSEPEFNNELLDYSTIKMLAEKIDTVIDKSMPSAYKSNSEYRRYVVKAYANEIIKSMFAQAILRNSVDENGNIAIERLKDEATLKSMLDYNPPTAENERQQVVSKIKKNLKYIDNTAIQNRIQKELKNVTLDDFKFADAVISQTKSGLNWRFDAAKDIGDLTAVTENRVSFQDIWNGTEQTEGVQQFWSEFISRIKQYNPSAYIIAEVTNLGDFYTWNVFDSMMKYDEKIANGYLENLKNDIIEAEPESKLGHLAKLFANTELPRKERENAFEEAIVILNSGGFGNEYGKRFKTFREYENNLPWSKEQKFLEQIGATTSSNYDKYFNRINYFVGVDPEDADYGKVINNVGTLGYLKTNTEHLLRYSQPNTAMLSHVFTDNHDKPRVAHALPLDMDLVVAGLSLKLKWRNISSLNELSDDDIRKEKIKEITGRDDLSNINPMAAAVGLMMFNKIEESSLSDKEKQELKNSLRKFVNGENNGTTDARRARAFGFLPYEITIKDLFKDAKITDENKIEEFNKLVMEEPMYLQDKIWQVTTALIGTPTLYYGTEYAQSGYETHTKNDLVGNRNRALHERKQNSIFSDFYKKINAVSALSNNPKLSALRNGFPESLEIYETDGLEMYPIYRKDERNNQVLSIITNFGIKQNTLSKDQGHKFDEQIESKFIPQIEIKNSQGISPLKEKTILKRAVYDKASGQYIAENIDYIIEKGCIKRKDKKDIEINDTLVLFYTEDTNKSKFTPVYNGAH